jgi:hypothetical protein
MKQFRSKLFPDQCRINCFEYSQVPYIPFIKKKQKNKLVLCIVLVK